MNGYRFVLVPVAEIAAEDETFRVALDPPEASLRASVAAHGLLQPLRLQLRADGRYRLVSGFKRFHLVHELGWEQVPALVVSERQNDLALYTSSLQERLAAPKPLSPLEIAEVLSKLRAVFALSEEIVVRDFMPSLGLGRNRIWLERYLPLSGLDERSKTELLREGLSLDVVFALPALAAEERHHLLDLFKALRLGKNKQSEMYSLIRDVCRMQRRSIGALLQQQGLAEILADVELTSTQKAERCKELLMRLRYPHFSLALQAFHDLLKEAGVPPALRISPSPFFNSEEVSIAFSFKDENEFRRWMGELQRLDAEGVIEKLVHLP